MTTKEEKNNMILEILALKSGVKERQRNEEDEFQVLLKRIREQNPELDEDVLWDYIWNDSGYIDDIVLP